MLTILAFLVVLGIVIAIHEFGHFAVAKLLKIRVLTFSLGFGPRLAGFERGGTDYRLSAFPLGGYVKMAGETYDDERPCMNILLAVGVFTTSYMEGVRVPRYLREPAIIGPVQQNSVARRAGLRSGDRVLSAAGNSLKTWEDLEVALSTAPRDSLEVVVRRGEENVRLKL
ncbi:MAG: RIP metalloprotease RseP, partial [Acidobacteria bacterium]